MKNIKFSITGGMRLPKNDKAYWNNQLQVFANQFDHAQVACVQYGKQDMRGISSITLVDNRHCVPVQRHFKDASALLAFIEGYNMAGKSMNLPFNIFSIFTEAA